MKRKVFMAAWLGVMAIAAGFLGNHLHGQDRKLSTANTSRYVGSGRWEWTVFIVAPAETVRDIQNVEYTLPPSFPDPIRKVSQLVDAQQPFALTCTGWGIFDISIKVTFRMGDVHFLKHTLDLKSQPVHASLPLRVNHQSSAVGRGMREWSVSIVGTSVTLDTIQLVKYTLPFFPNEFFSKSEHEIATRGSGDKGFELTGVCDNEFEVQIRIYFKNGRHQDMSHRISFAD